MIPQNIFGFSILRNGIKYDYPYKESLKSLSGMCSKVYLALGESEDGTEKTLGDIKNLEIINTKWDENKREGGLVLSEQTNYALQALRDNNKKGWAFYLQSDEVLLESEYEQMKLDFNAAEEGGYDAISFRYLHFWLSSNKIAIAKRWYPQELRAIRIDSDILSSGDAQSFQGAQKVFQSDAHVFHYGHVREHSAYEKKKTDFHRWWHKDEKLSSVLKNSKIKDSKEMTINYFGNHPKVMQSRIEKLGDCFLKPKVSQVYIYCDQKTKESLGEFVLKIRAENIKFIYHWKELKKYPPKKTVLFKNLTLIQRIFLLNRYNSKVPRSLYSPLARKWSKNFELVLRLSEREVGFGE